MKKIALALVPMAFLVVGCADEPGSELPHPKRMEEFVVEVPGDTDKTIFSFTTPDGMPCLSNWEGALTCDWSKSSRNYGGIR